MNRQTLEQRRSQHAWQAVQKIKELSKKESKGKKESKDLAGHAKKLPMRIKSAGLGQALAFINAKLNSQDNALHQELGDWVLRERGICGEKNNSLIESLISGSSDTLRRSTEEVLSWLEWFNRFAEAEGLRDES